MSARTRSSLAESSGWLTSDVVLFGPLELAVVVDHHPHELREAHRRLPAELLLRLRVVADEEVDLGRAEVAWIDLHVLVPVEACVTERLVEELAHRMRLPGGEHVVLGLVHLQHPPRAVHVVARVAPVALRVEIAETERVLLAADDRADRARDLAGHERRPTARRLVVEEDAVHRVHAVRLAVVAR